MSSIALHPLLKPVQIGNVQINTPLFLAPMAGHTDYAFRVMCREQGDCGLVCTELISSDAMQYADAKRRALMKFDWEAHESPVAVQLFGGDPHTMAEAAKIVEAHGADIVDINMGCWVPKIARSGGGAVLLKDVCTATAVVEAVVKAVKIPVTVKVRSGWERSHPTAVPFAKAAKDAGVQAIAVHARFATQGFKGRAEWDMIGEVKAVVGELPVIGNGDVKTTADALEMLERTGCDGVMIGRGALGMPWIFHHIAHQIRTGEILPSPTFEQRAEMALRQARLNIETTRRDVDDAVRILRQQIVNYLKGTKHAARLREMIVQAKSLQEIERLLEPLLR